MSADLMKPAEQIIVDTVAGIFADAGIVAYVNPQFEISAMDDLPCAAVFLTDSLTITGDEKQPYNTWRQEGWLTVDCFVGQPERSPRDDAPVSNQVGRASDGDVDLYRFVDAVRAAVVGALNDKVVDGVDFGRATEINVEFNQKQLDDNNILTASLKVKLVYNMKVASDQEYCSLATVYGEIKALGCDGSEGQGTGQLWPA